MKNVNVVAAIIKKENKILITQRGYGEFKGKWEFPGGKIEENETKIEALKREIKEELNISINVNQFLYQLEYDYPSFHLSMSCYLCELIDENITLIEHLDKKWISKNEIDNIDFLEADFKLIPILKEVML